MSYIDLSPTSFPPEAISLKKQEWTVAEMVVKSLDILGAKYAFGVSGGEIAPIWEALEYSKIETLHFRHEGGAAFAACEYSIATGEPAVVFVTGGPGIAHALNGLIAAKKEGARVIFLAPYSDSNKRDKFACQESTHEHFPSNLLIASSVFDYSVIVESPAQLQAVFTRCSNSLATLGSSVIGLFISQRLQKSPCPEVNLRVRQHQIKLTCSSEIIEYCAELMANKKLLIWTGFGARKSAGQLREFAEKTGAMVMSTPRGKGAMPEDHPQFIGVTGLGGQEGLQIKIDQFQPDLTIILGSKLGELASFWDQKLIPSPEIIHVDINSKVFGIGFPKQATTPVLADVAFFLEKVLPLLPTATHSFQLRQMDHHHPPSTGLSPSVVMEAVQAQLNLHPHTMVISEAGNSLAWANNRLRFPHPTYRASMGHASMGHAVAGVLGLSLANKDRKAIAIVGDGAMLMNGTEVNTAVKYKINSIWIVLNDGGYNMCRQGNRLQGMKEVDCDIPPADFVAFAESRGIRVKDEVELIAALEEAMLAEVPYVLDMVIDRNVPAPIGARVSSLKTKNNK